MEEVQPRLGQGCEKLRRDTDALARMFDGRRLSSMGSDDDVTYQFNIKSGADNIDSP